MQINTRNTTYTLDFSKVVKTTPKQRQEYRDRFLALTAQRIVALLLIVVCTSVSAYTEDGMLFVVGLLLGSAMFFCKNLFCQEE